jgi:UDP-glucose 4-epimerase
MNIALTGATGFLGQNVLAWLLVQENFSVIINTRQKNKAPVHRRVKIVEGDLRDKNVCDHLIAHSDILLHFGQSIKKTLDSSLLDDAAHHVLPSLTLFDAVKAANKNYHIIIASSGGGIYKDKHPAVPFLETDAIEIRDTYNLHKVITEEYLKILCAENKNITANILRIANPYGVLLPESRGQGFIGVAINRLKQGDALHVWDNLDTVRDYLHLDDLTSAIAQAIAYKKSCSVFNIGSGTGTSIADILSMIEHFYGRKIPVTLSSGNKKSANNWSVLNINKAKNILGWSPKACLADGIQKMVHQYLSTDTVNPLVNEIIQ